MPSESEDEAINALLDRYEENLERGEILTAEDLCSDRPELLPEIRRRIEALGRFASWDSPVKPVETIGQYRIKEWVGRGGMGEVYKAVHTGMDRLVALKILPADRTFSREAVARFKVELRSLGRLGSHPNVVLSLDGGAFDGRHYLVMEFIDGKNLSTLIEEHGPLPLSDACVYARQAALGLQYIHERGICHRDIKPSNLMLTRDGVLKVTDLGLALLEQPGEDGRQALTSSRWPIGTYFYMSPEQARDSHNVDAGADIYSLGATLYKLLTGRAPFEGPGVNTNMDALAALLQDRAAPPIVSLRPEIPADLARLIDRMLSKDRDQRPASAAAVASALEPFASGNNHSVSQSRPRTSSGGRFPAIARMSSRQRIAMLALSVVSLCSLILIMMPRFSRIPTVPHEDPRVVDNPDRRVAEVLINIGGRLDIMPRGADDEVEDVTKLEQITMPFVIRSIYLPNNPGVDDTILEEVSRLREIDYLELFNAKKVTDAGVANLERCRTLKKLDLRGTSVTDDVLVTVAKLTTLVTLKLSNTVVSDRNLELMKGLNGLRELYLSHTRVTNRGMKYLAGLKQIDVLDLHENNKIDDRGLADLETLESPSVIYVGSTGITPGGIRKFQNLHPDCKVTTEAPR